MALISDCCGVAIVENTESGDGEDAMCGKCFEHMPYYDDEAKEGYKEVPFDEKKVKDFFLVHTYDLWLEDLSDTYTCSVYVNFDTREVMVDDEEPEDE